MFYKWWVFPHPCISMWVCPRVPQEKLVLQDRAGNWTLGLANAWGFAAWATSRSGPSNSRKVLSFVVSCFRSLVPTCSQPRHRSKSRNRRNHGKSNYFIFFLILRPCFHGCLGPTTDRPFLQRIGAWQRWSPTVPRGWTSRAEWLCKPNSRWRLSTSPGPAGPLVFGTRVPQKIHRFAIKLYHQRKIRSISIDVNHHGIFYDFPVNLWNTCETGKLDEKLIWYLGESSGSPSFVHGENTHFSDRPICSETQEMSVINAARSIPGIRT